MLFLIVLIHILICIVLLFLVFILFFIYIFVQGYLFVTLSLGILYNGFFEIATKKPGVTRYHWLSIDLQP